MPDHLSEPDETTLRTLAFIERTTVTHDDEMAAVQAGED